MLVPLSLGAPSLSPVGSLPLISLLALPLCGGTRARVRVARWPWWDDPSLPSNKQASPSPEREQRRLLVALLGPGDGSISGKLRATKSIDGELRACIGGDLGAAKSVGSELEVAGSVRDELAAGSVNGDLGVARSIGGELGVARSVDMLDGGCSRRWQIPTMHDTCCGWARRQTLDGLMSRLVFFLIFSID